MVVATIVDFVQSVSLGSVLIILTIVVSVLTIRSQVFRNLRERADVAETKVTSLEHERTDLRAEIEAEKVKRDLTPILEQSVTQTTQVLSAIGEMMVRWDGSSDQRAEAFVEHLDKSLNEHEEKAQQRHDSQIRVLAAIEERLTKEGT